LGDGRAPQLPDFADALVLSVVVVAVPMHDVLVEELMGDLLVAAVRQA